MTNKKQYKKMKKIIKELVEFQDIFTLADIQWYLDKKLQKLEDDILGDYNEPKKL